MFNTKQKCRLVIFVSSVSRLFGLVTRFAYAMKENKTKQKDFIVRALKIKQVGDVFSSVAARKIPPR